MHFRAVYSSLPWRVKLEKATDGKSAFFLLHSFMSFLVSFQVVDKATFRGKVVKHHKMFLESIKTRFGGLLGLRNM